MQAITMDNCNVLDIGADSPEAIALVECWGHDLAQFMERKSNV